jgi:hypothetical protein
MLRALGRTAARAGLSFPLWLLGSALLLVELVAWVALLPTLGVGAFPFAGWLWLRKPNLLAFTLACLAAAGAAFVFGSLAYAARNGVRAFRFRLDPRAAAWHRMNAELDARFAMDERWHAYARLRGGPYLPQHPGDP